MSIKKKTKGTIKRNETPKMSLTWFLLHLLAEYAPKSAEDDLTKLHRVTARHIREEGEIILKLFYLARLFGSKLSFNEKPKRNFEQTKSAKIFQAWFWMHFLAEHARKYVQGQKAFTEFKLKMIFGKKTKSSLKNKKDLQKHLNLILETLFTRSRFALSISISNFSHWLQEPLGIEQKIRK